MKKPLVTFAERNLRRIYTTFILGMEPLSFGTRANNFGHVPLDFCHVNANVLARVPKNLGGARPPLEVVPARLKRVRVPKLEKFSSPEPLGRCLITKAKALG